MHRFAYVSVLVVLLFVAPAFGDPSADLAFIQTLPLIFQGRCFGNEVDGLPRPFPCEVRALEKRLWPQELYYLIISTEDGRETLAISVFRVGGGQLLFVREE